MADLLTDERRAAIKAHLVFVAEEGMTIGDVYVRDLLAENEQLRQRIDELERDRAGRPNWSDGRDLAIKLRDERATDDEIRDAFLGLWGGDQ